MKPYIVSTSGIKLVPTQGEHQELLQELEVCSDLVCGNTNTSVLSGRNIDDYLQKCQKIWEESGAIWSVIAEIQDQDKGSLDEEIGVIALEKVADSYELNYWIKRRYASTLGVNALKLVLLEAFQEIEANRIVWHGEVGNWDAWKLAWENGFIREGICRVSEKNKQFWQASLLASDPLKPNGSWDGPTDTATLENEKTDSEDESSSSTPIKLVPADSKDPEALVKQFHQVYALPIVREEPQVDIERVHMRMSLILEETAELVGAVYGKKARAELEQTIANLSDDHTRDVVETADALADLVYVTYGMALECGISLPDVLAEVQASNLSKLGADGKPIYREDGKVLKGPGFFPPDVKRALEKRISE